LTSFRKSPRWILFNFFLFTNSVIPLPYYMFLGFYLSMSSREWGQVLLGVIKHIRLLSEIVRTAQNHFPSKFLTENLSHIIPHREGSPNIIQVVLA
jgi:hypothetical protein